MPKTSRAPTPNAFHLYERAVQSIDADLDFTERVYKKLRGKPFTSLREDFCGTAAFACGWVKRGRDHVAIGVDLDRATLDEGIRRNAVDLGSDAARMTLLCADVRTVTRPKVDVVAAFNFSYWIFKQRAHMLEYFRAVRRSLKEDGIYVVDFFGGTEGMVEATDTRAVPAGKAPDGTPVPRFKYIWEQARFNPIDHHFICHIHFELADGTKIRRAFSYDWRFWTVAEVREVLLEAGFTGIDVYMDDWDEDQKDSNGIFRRRRYFDNEGCWVGYMVAYG